MERNTDNTDIEQVLRRLGEKLSSLSDEKLEAFFDKLFDGDDKPTMAVKLKGPRISTAISISKPLLQKLKRYMETTGIRSSVSAVVEYLVWQYLGEPVDLIETAPRVNKSRGTRVNNADMDSSSDFIAVITDKSVISILESEDDDRDNKGRRTKKTK